MKRNGNMHKNVEPEDSSYRNLGKGKLAGVIFGCNASTMKECLTKQLFGLPNKHYAYVMNIEPGMTVFLFNYTERKLYGIFEATSNGQMNIDPYGWTADGDRRTQYPAQVQVRTQVSLQSLHEFQFKSIISDNYYKNDQFWFELDHPQTTQLKFLLSSSNFKCLALSGGDAYETQAKNLYLKVSSENNENAIEQLASSNEDHGNTSLLDRDMCYNAAIAIPLIEENFTHKPINVPEEISYESQIDSAQIEAENESCSLKDCSQLESVLEIPESFPDVIRDSSDDICSDNINSIYLFGGFDGTDVLADFDAYYPNQDVITSLCPMTSARSYASVSVLQDRIYVIGGGNGGSWYNTVEAYNFFDCQWTAHSLLKQKKGCLASVTLSDKVFAIGGGNGNECFSQVEMLDIDIGRWIPTQSMRKKRFSLSATVLNGAIYAAGGYDGNDYLRSVERFDPREHAWRYIPSMNSKRGCHSLVTLNNKLYALGGYNGLAIARDTEVYDVRGGAWINGDLMNRARGYAASVTLQGCICIIGGVSSEEFNTSTILDTVEQFREGQGWKESSISIGRCFLSAISL